MARLRQWCSFGALILVALVMAHDLVFLVGYGANYHEALAQTGHGVEWETTAAAVLLAAAAVLVLSIWRLRRLGLFARSLPAHEGELSPTLRAFPARVMALWIRLATVTGFILVLQENLEHLQAGEELPGLGVLGSAEYPFACLVIAGVALVVAAVAALLSWQRERLAARLASAPRRDVSPESTLAEWALDLDRRPSSHVGRGLAVRAPPLVPV
jgi:hypothetical protein